MDVKYKKSDLAYTVVFIITFVMIFLLCSCTKHKICTCENTNIGNRVQIDITQCYHEYKSCEDLNEIINYDACMDF